jgi:hypothetical protein
MANLQDYLRIKEEHDKAQQAVSKAEGALEQVLEQLKEKFGCDSLEEGQKKLKKISQREQETQNEFDKAVEKFDKDWPEEDDLDRTLKFCQPTNKNESN